MVYISIRPTQCNKNIFYFIDEYHNAFEETVAKYALKKHLICMNRIICQHLFITIYYSLSQNLCNSFSYFFHGPTGLNNSVRLSTPLNFKPNPRELNKQALFWSAHRRISAHFPRISDPSEISTNLLRYWSYI